MEPELGTPEAPTEGSRNHRLGTSDSTPRLGVVSGKGGLGEKGLGAKPRAKKDTRCCFCVFLFFFLSGVLKRKDVVVVSCFLGEGACRYPYL